MIMTIDMVTGEVSDDSCSQRTVETVSASRPGMQMPRDLEPGLQTYDTCITHNPTGAFPDSLVNVRIDSFVEQMKK